MGEEVRQVTASLGFERSQDLVGRSELLVQARAGAAVDLHELIRPIDDMLDLEPLDMPEPPDEREAAGLIAARPLAHARAPWPSDDRALGTKLAGRLARRRIAAGGLPAEDDEPAALRFDGGSIGGQGLGAFNVDGVDITVEGGAQDGVGKTMLGGKVAVLKGLNRLGRRVNGSVGKSFAYGAQRGPVPGRSAGVSSCRATPTRASASGSRAPTW